MRRYMQGLLLLGLSAVPLTAQAQYMAPNYYYSQSMPAYNPYYPYGYQGMATGYPQMYPQAQWGQPTYYYGQPAYSAPMYYTSTSRYPSPAAYPVAKPMPPAPAPVVAPPAPPMVPSVTSKPQPPQLPLTVTSPQSAGDPPAGEGSKSAIPEPMPSPAAEGQDLQPGPVVPTLPAPGGCKNCKGPGVAIGPPTDGSCLPNCPCTRQQKFMAFGEFLYWTVHGADVPYAQAFDGTNPLASVPRGPVGVASPNFNGGYRVGGGVAFGDHCWVIGTYTNFRDDTTSTLTAADGNVLHASLVFPNTVNSAGDSLTARAQYDINLITGDLDFKYAFIDTSCWQLSVLAGARYAHLEQDLTADYVITGTTTVDSRITFDGGGPRIGLDGQYTSRCGVFGYGKGILSLLAGQFSGSYTERNIFTGLVGQTSFTDDRLVPVLEFELGVGWQSPKGHVRLSGGYYVGAWFNTMTTQSLASSIQGQGAFNFNMNNFTTSSSNFHDTITFDGLVARVELRY